MRINDVIKHLVTEGMDPKSKEIAEWQLEELTRLGIEFLGAVKVADSNYTRMSILTYTVLRRTSTTETMLFIEAELTPVRIKGEEAYLYPQAKALWEANFDSPFPELAGYRTYWGILLVQGRL